MSTRHTTQATVSTAKGGHNESNLRELEAPASAGWARGRCVVGVRRVRRVVRQQRIKVAIMTDCKGAFAFGYESTSAARRRRSPQYAGAKPKNPNKPSAGMTGITPAATAQDRRLRLRQRHGRRPP